MPNCLSEWLYHSFLITWTTSPDSTWTPRLGCAICVTRGNFCPDCLKPKLKKFQSDTEFFISLSYTINRLCLQSWGYHCAGRVLRTCLAPPAAEENLGPSHLDRCSPSVFSKTTVLSAVLSKCSSTATWVRSPRLSLPYPSWRITVLISVCAPPRSPVVKKILTLFKPSISWMCLIMGPCFTNTYFTLQKLCSEEYATWEISIDQRLLYPFLFRNK